MNKYSVKNQILLSLIANIGSILYGISLGWNSVFENLYQIFDDKWFSWTFLLASLGAALTCVIAGIFRSRYGTKFAIVIFSLPNVIGWLLLILVENVVAIIFGRLLIALSSGAYCLIIPIYIGEIASREIRGMLLMSFDLSVKFGALCSYILFRYTSVFVISIICGSLVVIYMVIVFYLPESPLFLFRKEQFGNAIQSIQKIRGASYNYSAEIAELQVQSDELDATKELKKPARRKSFFIIICMFFFMQLSGINVVLFYAPSIFIEAGVVELNPMIIIYLIQMLTVLSTMFLVDRFSYGRKKLLISSLSMTMIGLIGDGIFFLLGYNGIEWILLFFLIIFIIGFSLGISSIPFVLIGELFTLDSKKVLAPVALTLYFAFSYFVALIFTLLANWIRVEFIFFLFAFICLIGFIFVWLFIPETRGKSLLEIQIDLRKKKILIFSFT